VIIESEEERGKKIREQKITFKERKQTNVSLTYYYSAMVFFE
jgi:hypothetical protein